MKYKLLARNNMGLLLVPILIVLITISKSWLSEQSIATLNTGPILTVDQPTERLISQISDNKLQAIKTMSVGKNLTAVIVSHAEPSIQPSLVYLDGSKQHLLEGQVIGPDGVNLTAGHINHVLQPIVDHNAWRALPKTQWLLDGHLKAKHKIYVLADPNSLIVRDYYFQTLKPAIDSGDLAVRWVLVGGIGRKSQQLTAQILKSQKPLINWHRQLEKLQGQQGPIKQAPPIKQVMSKNLQFLLTYRYHQFPTTLFKTTDQKLHVVYGFIQDEILMSGFLPNITSS